jgi:hypothetical protein
MPATQFGNFISRDRVSPSVVVFPDIFSAFDFNLLIAVFVLLENK